MSASQDYNVYGGALFGMSSPVIDSTSGTYGKVPIPSNVSGLMGGVVYKNDFSKLPLLIVAAQEDKDVEIYAQPQIVANNNEEAFFESSVQVPTLKTNIGSDGQIISQSSEYHTASLKLLITPHITQEDYLRLEIEQNTERFDLASALVNLPPPKTSRTAKTVVTIPDRTTVLLGGLKSEDGSWSIKKIPLLGDIPLLRHFFRRKTWSESNSNVFVFISAYIIRDDNDYERISQEQRDELNTMMRLHEEYGKDKKKKK
jgi:general secretion pathway protein D